MQLPAALLHRSTAATLAIALGHDLDLHLNHNAPAMALALHSVGALSNPRSVVLERGRRGAVCRAVAGDREVPQWRVEAEVEVGEEEEEELELDSSVFEEVYQSVKRVHRKPVGAHVKGLPSPQSTLVPEGWKDVQQYLHRSKKERKQETLARQLEWAKRRALEERLTRAELENERREGEPVSEGATAPGSSSGGALLVSDDVEELPLGVQTTSMPNSGSGRARPKDFRSELQLTTIVEEIAESRSTEEEGGSGSESEDDLIRKTDSEGALGRAPGAGEKKHLLTPEEQAVFKSRKLNFARVSSRKWSPLHTLAASGQVYLAAELLKKGVDLDAVDVDGLTPLHRAVQAGRKTMVRLLVKAGANVQVLDSEGATLLHYSALVGDLGITKILLRHGVDASVADADGWTPLHVAVQSGRLEVIKILVYRGADIDIANKDGNTALDLGLAFGATFNFYDAIKFLKKMSVGDSVSRSARSDDDLVSRSDSIEDDDDEAP